MICRGLCACTEMLWMCVLYVSFGSKVRPRTFGCVAMGSALLFIVRSRLLVNSAGSGVNRVQVVLSGFSKRLFTMNLMIVPGMFVCSSFLISVCMFIVSKVLLISSATVIVRAGGAIWLNPFATVLFSVCSAVTVECCVLYPCCMGVFGLFAVM